MARQEAGRTIDSSEDESEESLKLLDTKFFFKEFKREIPNWESQGRLSEAVLELVAEKVSEDRLPVRDIVDHFRRDDGEALPEGLDLNAVSKADFVGAILGDCFGLEDELTEIKLKFLGVTFEDADYASFVEIDRFLASLKTVAEKMQDKRDSKLAPI
jgi:hypothetical protein